ncbi:MAG: hypothetical protein WCO91_10935, partial [Gemmataceae bacterium]
RLGQCLIMTQNSSPPKPRGNFSWVFEFKRVKISSKFGDPTIKRQKFRKDVTPNYGYYQNQHAIFS